jgi:hypothetical protein
MANLSVNNVSSPGALGLNTENAGVEAPTDFAKEALNCVVTRDNRLSARKGFENLNPTVPFTGTVKTIYQVINTDGTTDYVWTAANKVYVGYPTKTDITGALTVTADNWQFCNLQNKLFATQVNHTPALWAKISGVWTAQAITMNAELTAEKPSLCLSAFGRVFLANGSAIKNKVWFSESLNPANFTTAGAGSIDLSTAMIGGDNVVAIAAFGNKLLFLCTKQILVYTVEEGGTPFLVGYEAIKGIGCVSRDSVINTGDDLLWLSQQGVVSLSRLINSGDAQMPRGDISLNVHNDIQQAISLTSDKAGIKACWWEIEKSYLLLFPSLDNIYVFNKRVNAGEGPAVTVWNTLRGSQCLYSDLDRNLLFGATARFYKYNNYGDNDNSYQFRYLSGFLDFGDPSTFKFLKTISFTIKTGNDQSSTVKWGWDYSDSYQRRAYIVQGGGGTISEYGVAEYGLSEYSTGPVRQDLRVPANGSGQSLQFGIETNINGNEFSLFRAEVQVTTGKVY